MLGGWARPVMRCLPENPGDTRRFWIWSVLQTWGHTAEVPVVVDAMVQLASVALPPAQNGASYTRLLQRLLDGRSLAEIPASKSIASRCAQDVCPRGDASVPWAEVTLRKHA